MKTQRKTNIATVLKLLIILLEAVLISVTGMILYRPFYMETSDGAYKDKLSRLTDISKSNDCIAVFVGGSTTHFGVSAELFEKETGIASVNMGLNAGVPFLRYIDDVSPYVEKGDIVFLMPEYSYYCKDMNKVDEGVVYYELFLTSSAAEPSDLGHTINYTKELLMTGWKNWEYICQGICENLLFHGSYGVYNSQCNNEYGDMVAHKGLSRKEVNASGMLKPNDTFYEALDEKIAALEDKGVTVFLLFQPYQHSSYVKSNESIQDIYKLVTDKMGHAVTLYMPEEVAYPDECFYDTVNHLTYESAQVFTEKIVEDYNAFKGNNPGGRI